MTAADKRSMYAILRSEKLYQLTVKVNVQELWQADAVRFLDARMKCSGYLR
jgi:hypothetical protein